MHPALDEEENPERIASPRLSLRLADGFEDGPQIRREVASFVGRHIPDYLVIHAAVIVYEAITHARHLLPLESGKPKPRFLWHFLGRLADHFGTSHESALEHFVLKK